MVVTEACIVLWLSLTSSQWGRVKSICGFVPSQWVTGLHSHRCVMWSVYSKLKYISGLQFRKFISCMSKFMPKTGNAENRKHTHTHTKLNERHKVFSNSSFFIKKSLLQTEDSRSIFCVKLSFLVGGKGYFCHSVLNVTKYTKSQKRKRRVEISNMCFCWHSQNTGKLSSQMDALHQAGQQYTWFAVPWLTSVGWAIVYSGSGRTDSSTIRELVSFDTAGL